MSDMERVKGKYLGRIFTHISLRRYAWLLSVKIINKMDITKPVESEDFWADKLYTFVPHGLDVMNFFLIITYN